MKQVENTLYLLIHWPESQIYMDTEKYPNAEYALNGQGEPAGSVFVPFEYVETENKWRIYHQFNDQFNKYPEEHIPTKQEIEDTNDYDSKNTWEHLDKFDNTHESESEES